MAFQGMDLTLLSICVGTGNICLMHGNMQCLAIINIADMYASHVHIALHMHNTLNYHLAAGRSVLIVCW